ncbi:MAG: hypothetical protein ACI30D_09125 [Muribaculaceae bacterium]
MSESESKIITCCNEECRRKLKVKNPFKPGKFPIKCPYCGTANIVEFTPADMPDNSTKEPIRLDEEFIVGSEGLIKCPHCGKYEKMYTPPKAGSLIIGCPKCKGRMQIEVKEKTKLLTYDLNRYMGKVVMIRKGWFNKEFPLRMGVNTVGRADPMRPSDISIKGDMSISRQSVQIKVGRSENEGIYFKFRVKKAANPVLYNDQILAEEDEAYMNFGDIFVLGQTRFRFEKDRLG